LLQLQVNYTWNATDLATGFKDWMLKFLDLKGLPCWICWYVWIHINDVIFEGSKTSVSLVCYRVLAMMKELQASKPLIRRIISYPIIMENVSLGWFDGSSQDSFMKCGAGGVIKIDDLFLIIGL
jgi:hypothetical protein